MSFANRRIVLADLEDRRLQQRRNRRAAEIAKQQKSGRASNPESLGAREARLIQILEEIQPARSRRPQLITQDLTYLTQLLGGILLEENPCDIPSERKKIAGMYVKLLDVISHIVAIRQPRPVDETMGATEGDTRSMPPAQPSSREINRMTPEDLRLWHQHRRDKMRRDASKYPTGHARGLNR